MILAGFYSQPVVFVTSEGELITTILAVVSALVLIPTLSAILGHLICHQRGCYRLGRFPHGQFKLCHVHHPNVPSDGKITTEHIARAGKSNLFTLENSPSQGGVVVSTPAPSFKFKPFTPMKVKADIAFVGSLIAVFGWNIPTTVSSVLLGGAALIALGVNAAEVYAEAHIHIGKRVIEDAAKALSEVRAVLPAVNELTRTLPGHVGEQIRKELELLQQGPSSGAAK